MAAKTKPMRVRESDIAPLQLLGHLERRATADILHDAVTEYLANHGQEFQRQFAAAQKALRAGDIDQLATLLSDDEQREKAASKAKDYLSSLR